MSITRALLLLPILATLRAAADPIVLVDRARAAGLSALAANGSAWYGGGVAFVDLDGDGWPDIYFGAGAGEVDTLCRNQRDGSFACAPVEGAPPNPGDVLAIAAGDVDGDGDLDLYAMGGGSNRLLANDGRGHFVDATARTGAGGTAHRITPTGTFFDWDGDGRLDLYLGHWFASRVLPVARDQVLRQTADGTFVDVTAQSGIDDRNRSTLALIAFDYDRDGRQDLYVTGDFADSILFHNDGAGRFSDVTAKQPPGFGNVITEGMGVDVADFDGDGTPDLYVTGNKVNGGGDGAALLANLGDGTFASRGAALGVNTGYSWGTGAVDLDNDGWPDLFVATDVADHHTIYRNRGGMGFDEQQVPGFEAGNNQCVTAVFADYDGDGRVDVLLHRLDGHHPQLLHNETVTANHWLQVLLRPDTLGARVEVRAGGRSTERELLSQTSKGAQNDRRFTFGLGQATSADVVVRFPDGKQVELSRLTVDREVVIDRDGLVANPGIFPPRSAGGCELGAAGSAPFPWLAFFALCVLGRRRAQRA